MEIGEGLEYILSKVEGSTKVQVHEFVVASVHVGAWCMCVCVCLAPLPIKKIHEYRISF